jgi:hypothetical protein
MLKKPEEFKIWEKQIRNMPIKRERPCGIFIGTRSFDLSFLLTRRIIRGRRTTFTKKVRSAAIAE